MARGTATLLACLAAAAAFPALSLLAHIPWWLGGGISAGVFGGVWLVLKPSTGGGNLSEAALEARSDTSRALLLEAGAAVDRLQRAGKTIRDKDMRDQVARLSQTGERVLKEVRANPERAMAVRRLLTFYLPNAASVAEGWRTLEGRSSPSLERMSQAREVMQGLSGAFAKYADDVAEPQLQTLDLDLKVLKDALQADLTTRP